MICPMPIGIRALVKKCIPRGWAQQKRFLDRRLATCSQINTHNIITYYLLSFYAPTFSGRCDHRRPCVISSYCFFVRAKWCRFIFFIFFLSGCEWSYYKWFYIVWIAHCLRAKIANLDMARCDKVKISLSSTIHFWTKVSFKTSHCPRPGLLFAARVLLLALYRRPSASAVFQHSL